MRSALGRAPFRSCRRPALADLDLSEAIVVHAGHDSYLLAAKVRAVAASRLDADLRI